MTENGKILARAGDSGFSGSRAPMRPCGDAHEQWFESAACGAAMYEADIKPAQQASVPRREPGITTKHEPQGMRPDVA